MFLFPMLVICQEDRVEIHGYLVDERNGQRLKDVLVVNKTTGDFEYGDENGNYSILIKREDEIIFSALGYSTVTFSLEDSILKPVYLVIPKLNRYSIIIRQVNIKAEREVQEIKIELDKLTQDYTINEQKETRQFSHPITAMYNRWSKREERKRKIERLKYLDRKKILLSELIRKSKLSKTELLSNEELQSFIDHLLNSDHLLKFSSQYELLAFINIECEKWMGMKW